MVEATVKFDFTGRSAEELTIKRGDFLRILKTKSDLETYWYFGELNGRVGLVPENHIQMKPCAWFLESMSRKDADHFLEGQGTGLFIIRHSESSPVLGSYSLSVKYDDKVKHFKICRSTEDGSFIIWLRKFKSLNDLVDFHKTHSVSISQDVKLIEVASDLLPISDSEYQEGTEYNHHLTQEAETQASIIRNGLSNLDISNFGKITTTTLERTTSQSPENQTQKILLVTKPVPTPRRSPERIQLARENNNDKLISSPCQNSVILAKALYDFIAEEKDELGFHTGQIITVTNKDDENWWQGSIQGKHGQFPASHVTILTP